MKPEGAVIWLLAGATVLVVFVLVPLAFSGLRRKRPVVSITDAEPPLDPVDPADPAGYASEPPAFDSAYAVEAGANGDEQ